MEAPLVPFTSPFAPALTLMLHVVESPGDPSLLAILGLLDHPCAGSDILTDLQLPTIRGHRGQMPSGIEHCPVGLSVTLGVRHEFAAVDSPCLGFCHPKRLALRPLEFLEGHGPTLALGHAGFDHVLRSLCDLVGSLSL
jgi:hypothetical protein